MKKEFTISKKDKIIINPICVAMLSTFTNLSKKQQKKNTLSLYRTVAKKRNANVNRVLTTYLLYYLYQKKQKENNLKIYKN